MGCGPTRYAKMLGLKFAYATNSHQILEFAWLKGK